MSERSVESVRHISITRTSADGTVSHTEVHITETGPAEGASAFVGAFHGAFPVPVPFDPAMAGDHFDPSTCCSEREQAMIASLRAYLRPEEAPECLKARIKACLDHCCEQ
ncbi:hypothetical protein JS528_02360 [Bifidobacterium sp. MA2]|uniref:Uncharacterized protein n=1 Tax=Bifidobacterium santillanense TaxID=2809028 RepID=A0ABS5UMS6_9BIFI|nr:hypothetical protein [Bifidobacterium santillanense]MBT1172221.1 hypothetical protein [Bifidobacterium santillanense]